MGHYLAVHLDFVSEPRSPFRGALDLDGFHVVGLGAVAPGAPAQRWFLAGFALEDFFVRFAGEETRSPMTTQLARTQPRAASDYLEQRLLELERAPFDPGELSPFELQEPDVLISSLVEGELDGAVVEEAEQWLSDHPEAVAHLYLAVDLVTQGRIRDRCFRWLAPDRVGRSPVGTPILFVRLARSRFQKGSHELLVHSSTPVWLRGANAFGGRVTADDAEENLQRLVRLLGGFASAGRVTQAELSLQGRLFQEEEARLRAAIGTGLRVEL